MTDITHRKRAHARNRALRMTIAVLAVILAPALAADAQNRRKADLVERQIANPPAQLSEGAAFMVSDVAANRGAASAGRSVTRYYLVSGGTVLPAGIRRVPALKRHHRSRGRIHLSIAADAPAGRYSLLACVDANRRVAESNERNNCRASRGRGVLPGPGGVIPPSSPPPPMTSADSDGDGFADSVDCAPHNPAIHPRAQDVPDPGFVDSNCDGIDGNPADAVFVSPVGNDTNSGTPSQPLLTLGAAITAAHAKSKDVYAAIGTYAEELRVAPSVSIYGGYGPAWQRSRSTPTRITGALLGSGDTEGAVAVNVSMPTTLQLLTISPVAPTVAGASSYGLRGVHSTGLRLERVTVVAAPGVPGVGGAAGAAGAPGGNGGDARAIVLAPGKAGPSPVGHPGGAGGEGSDGHGSGPAPGQSGQSTVPDAWNRMGGPGGPVGTDAGTNSTGGGRGNDGDFGVPILLGDGAGAGPGNALVGSGFWRGHDGQDGRAGTDGHGGGGGGGAGGSGDGYGGGGGGGGGGGQGGGGGRGGQHGGGSFGIFLVDCAGAVVRDSFVRAADGGQGGSGGGGSLGGAGGAGGVGGAGAFGSNSGGDGGRGGGGGRGSDGGGGAGGPSAAIVGLTPSDTPGTVSSHGVSGAGGPGGVGAGNGGGRGADGPAADFLADGP